MKSYEVVEAMGARRAQDLDEAHALLEFMRNVGVVNYGEIGLRHGWFFYQVASEIRPKMMVGVDWPGIPPWGDDGSEQILVEVAAKAREMVPKTRVLLGDSKSVDALDGVEKALDQEGLLDFLLIDGDHTYNGVLGDFELYRDYVCDGGYIAFHDIKPPARENDPIGVPQFWNEIKDQYEHWEITLGGNKLAAGVGIVRV
jgi:cephalosporin hydroxylase